MITAEMYEILRPHRDAIVLTAETRATVSNTPFDAMAEIFKRMQWAPVDASCGRCVIGMYVDVAHLIKEYENQNK